MSQSVHPALDGFLDNLADSLGRAIADNGGGVLVHVVARPDGPDVGILPLDSLAPADVLLGTIAPGHWAVLGVATTGWARPLGRRGGRGRVRTEVVVLVARDGGRDFAALFDTADVDDLLRTAHKSGASPQELKEVVTLLAETYRWARGRRWTTRNPTADTRVRDIVG